MLQRINEHDFKDTESLMENVQRISAHLQEREAAAMFGQFQNLLSDLPPPRLYEPIPAFPNTPASYQQFHEALERDSYNRAQQCKSEINYALAYEVAAGRLIDLESAGILTERIAHNDTRPNNVMFDEGKGKAICVKDLDTVMPGLVLFDFGDLVRSATASASEDEADLSQIRMRLDCFEALVEGYLSTAIQFLTDAEIENLPMAGKVITIETGVRFLTDYLSGDEYFRIQRPRQNFDRRKGQFALAASIDAQFNEMKQLVAKTVSAINSKAS